MDGQIGDQDGVGEGDRTGERLLPPDHGQHLVEVPVPFFGDLRDAAVPAGGHLQGRELVAHRGLVRI
jgi:hypothetical protein